MNLLNASPMPQPANLFTLDECRLWLKDLEHVRSVRPRPSDTIWEMESQYHSRLPVYLLARCAICGGRVWEAIDTYSLNGLGWWGGGLRGYGWGGLVGRIAPKDMRNHPEEAYETYPSYQTDCPHVVVVDWCVNLNNEKPTDVFHEVYNVLEVPYVMKLPIEAQGVTCVMHALNVGRWDDAVPMPHYTAYFMTYFAEDKTEFERVIAPFYSHQEADTGLVSGPYYTGLEKWVKLGKLYWLDRKNPQLLLRSHDVLEFPYANVQGIHGPMSIVDGKVKKL